MNEICLEKCNLNRRCSHFEMRRDINLDDFYFDADWFVNRASPDERKVDVAVFIKLLLDERKGTQYVHTYRPIRRDNDRKRSSQVSQAFPIPDLLSIIQERDTTLQNTEVGKDQKVGVDEVVGGDE